MCNNVNKRICMWHVQDLVSLTWPAAGFQQYFSLSLHHCMGDAEKITHTNTEIFIYLMTISFVDTNKLAKDAKLKTLLLWSTSEIPLDLRVEINSIVDWPALLAVHYRAGSGRLKRKEPSLHTAARRGAVDPRLQSDWRTGAEEILPEQPTTRLLSEPDTDSISASFSNAVWQEDKKREWIIIFVQLVKPKEFAHAIFIATL